ncbi:hypothetical protein GPX89_15850 [Nocardia sp. ET3-3]|uniref:PH domain-containing protein n=1 Tax=Nocardia terrae TaxID=2675851 RepID=A0A7K1UWE8_9NOCA|nr:hypothetical protein [Nocardia terrae]MVU78713.1 hypothetical protein [Nocardia terrae]
MNTQYDEVPGTDATPTGYRWVLRWPPSNSSTAAGIAFGVGFTLVLGVLTALFAVAAHTSGAPWGGVVFVGSLALMIPLTAIFGNAPARIEHIQGGVAVPRRPWKHQAMPASIVLTVAGIGITMIGFEVHTALFTVMGLVLTVLAVAIGIGNLANRRPLIFTTEYVACGDTWRIPWSEITRLRGKDTSGRGPRPYVSFRTLDPTTISGASARRYVVMMQAWNLDPNAVLSAMRFMVESPGTRADVSSAQFEAMLAAPPRTAT